ncbi:uncharacterized protein N7496_009744 [Penicillium cataractarum]|uniref:SET domain-containing protein n=1 Tax=Penicillium cataractarum TaxID=2100454 RepID=A0A9W9V2R1_9EURO|nr:uncharacterized protein N7496_009744 [Penicillium cataractarum]KAJ5364031.1 hypothetical protein N7496_009744 [Penicillium cataractarum]
MSQVVYITLEEPIPNRIDGIPKTQSDWIHPNLIESVDPVKGRQLRASEHIPKGTCVLIDHPYAIIPVVDDPATNDDLICSNSACNRRSLSQSGRLSCSNSCIADVSWCSSTCRDADKARHDFECTWLKRYADPIRKKWGEYDFGMLWVIVRLLASRQTKPRPQNENVLPTSQPLKHGWAGIESLCGSVDTWPHEQVRSWTTLVKKYLQNGPVLPHGLSADQVLHLICQEEANSFGLYPRETGIYPPPQPLVGRGEQFAAAVYPTAAMANHSCVPNMTHKPDEDGRMIFTASRDILPGQECCISYFDLTKHTDLTSRREHLRKSFKFTCQCDRCVSEEPAEETNDWTPMPMMDI